MLIESHCKTLTTLIYDREGFKKQFPTYSYMHGMVLTEAMATTLWGDKVDLNISADIETNEYHALIIDNEIRDKIAAEQKGAPLKDILTEKDTRAVVERFRSSEPAEIQAFINKWLDPKFTFDV